jgi:hypothetical protein
MQEVWFKTQILKYVSNCEETIRVEINYEFIYDAKATMPMNLYIIKETFFDGYLPEGQDVVSKTICCGADLKIILQKALELFDLPIYLDLAVATKQFIYGNYGN